MKRLLLSLSLVLVTFSAAAGQNAGAVKLEGQAVCCEECWARADRKTTTYGTRADLEAAAECIESGDPTMLAVAKHSS